MTDSTSASSTTTASQRDSAKAAPASNKKPTTPKARRSSAAGVLAVILLVLVAAIGVAAWYLYQQQRTQYTDLLNQLQAGHQAVAQADQRVQALQAQVDMNQGRIQQLASEHETTREQADALERALQMMTESGGDLALINDVDQLVGIAHQQLALGGSLPNAIIALETAQARLARAARPSLAPLQEAVNGDLQRLRAVPVVDTDRLKAGLDELNALVAVAPMLIRDLGVGDSAVETAGTPTYTPTPVDPDASWWQRGWVASKNAVGQGWHLVSHDLRELVSVRRIDDADALLVSADQAGQLRDNLRLRLMMAKLALLMRQSDVWQAEMQAIDTLMTARFDLQTTDGKRAAVLAAQLGQADIAVSLPDTLNSQQVLQTLREAHAGDHAPEPVDLTAPDTPDPAASDADPADEGKPSVPPAPDETAATSAADDTAAQDTAEPAEADPATTAQDAAAETDVTDAPANPVPAAKEDADRQSHAHAVSAYRQVIS